MNEHLLTDIASTIYIGHIFLSIRFFALLRKYRTISLNNITLNVSCNAVILSLSTSFLALISIFTKSFSKYSSIIVLYMIVALFLSVSTASKEINKIKKNDHEISKKEKRRPIYEGIMLMMIVFIIVRLF